MKFTRKSGLGVLFSIQWVLLLICLIILFLVPVAYTQETQTVLKPNQLVAFSLVPQQEKLFVLQMKKGDFAEIQWLASEFLPLSFEIYDSARKELFVQSNPSDEFIWFVAPRDGDFLLVSKLEKKQYPEASDANAQKISIQYNNKFKLPLGTELNSTRKVNGFDVKIMTAPNVLLIEKNGKLQGILKTISSSGFSFGDEITSANSAKEKRSVQLIKTTVDKTGDGNPDLMIYDEDCGASGRSCSIYTYFIDLGDAVKISERIDPASNSGGLLAIGKNPKGGLIFELKHEAYFGSALVILEFRNGILRPNIDLMKKPPPSLAVLKSKAQKFRNQLSLKPYKGIDNEDSVLYNEDFDYESSFADVMLDLIFTGNEELAWQFLDLVWLPQKRGKELFIRDFKNKLLQSPYWQMILEDRRNNSNLTTTIKPNLSSSSITPGTLISNSLGMKFAYVPAGEFQMGGTYEKPIHTVKISRGFRMQTTEVTQAQWKAIMGSLPTQCDGWKFEGEFVGDNKPIICVSWDDAQDFITKLNARNEGTYRLPTEAEWEYACRAGTTGEYAGNLDAMAWYDANSGKRIHEVATKQANGWGLFDMHGNVWEWVQDWSGDYPNGMVTDPTGASTSWDRMARGGSWLNPAEGLRSANRYNHSPSRRDSYIGFRVVQQ